MTIPSDPMPEQGATPPPVPEGAVPPPPPAGAVPPPAYSAPPPGYQAPPPGYQAPPPGYQAPPPGYQAPPPGYAAPPPGYAAPAAPMSDSDQRMWAMLSHLGGLLFWFVAPLVIWLIFRERGRFVDEQAKEALNFQILMTIVYIVGIITTPIIIGFVILPVAGIAALIFIIMAAIAANKGQAYRYPVNLRLIK